MFVACGIWCLADVSSVSPSSEQTKLQIKVPEGKQTSLRVSGVSSYRSSSYRG